MKRIKGIKETKEKYTHRLKPKIEKQEIKETNCFALVVVRHLPWYKKLAKKIRNFIVIYRWRKAR